MLTAAIFSPPALHSKDLYFALVFYLKNILSDFCQTTYLNIYKRTDLYGICRIGRTLAVDKRSDVIFSIPQGTLPWQPILWIKSTSNTHLVVRMTFARAAPPAYDIKDNCYVGHTQTNYLTRWTQVDKTNTN